MIWHSERGREIVWSREASIMVCWDMARKRGRAGVEMGIGIGECHAKEIPKTNQP